MVEGSRHFTTARSVTADRPCQRCGLTVPYETVKRLVAQGRPLVCKDCKSDRGYMAAMAAKG